MSELETALRRLGDELDVDSQPDYVTLVRSRLTAPGAAARLRHPLLAASCILGIALSVLLLGPATRNAVADLFGFGVVKVHPLPPTTTSPRTTVAPDLELGTLVSLTEAQRQVAFAIAVPRGGLAVPDQVFVRRGTGLEAVTLVYRPRAGFPATVDPGVGLLVSEFAGDARPYFDKYLGRGGQATPVTVGGRWPGIYFHGPQAVAIRGPGQEPTFEEPRLAGPSLVWIRNGVTYRLEAGVGQSTLLLLAASLR